MSKLRVNVGCGPYVVDGWVNVDKSPSVVLSRWPRLRRGLGRLRLLSPHQVAGLPEGVIHADVTKRMPVGDGEAEFVYSGHMIEHLSRWQALAFLRECRRVLAPDGTLRISTPDLAQLVQSYLDGEIRYESTATPADSFVTEYGAYSDLAGGRMRRVIHRVFSGAIHQWLYDRTSLTRLLEEAGFSSVIACGYREGRVPDLALLEHRPRSLFVEARAIPRTT